jgi:hypothetical protein
MVELDGVQFHDDRGAFEADRDAEMLAIGLVTVCITWERLTQRPGREAKRLSRSSPSADLACLVRGSS